MCIVWTVYACAAGRGKAIRWCLNRPNLVVLSRLSYCFYLVSTPIIILKNLSAKTTVPFTYVQNVSYFVNSARRLECPKTENNLLTMKKKQLLIHSVIHSLIHSISFVLQFRDAFADMVFSYLAAFLLFILFEAPVYAVDKLVNSSCRRSISSKRNVEINEKKWAAK